MVRSENIETKLNFLRSCLKKLDRYRSMAFAEIATNDDLRGALERYLYLATQSAIDLVEMLCKLKSYGKAESMAGAVELLFKNGVIDQELYSKLVKMVSFRNYLAHGYEKLDYKVVEEVLRDHLGDLKLLGEIVEKEISG